MVVFMMQMADGFPHPVQYWLRIRRLFGESPIFLGFLSFSELLCCVRRIFNSNDELKDYYPFNLCECSPPTASDANRPCIYSLKFPFLLASFRKLHPVN